MILNVKSQQIISQQTFQDFFSPRANSEGLRVGPWNMPEMGEDGIGNSVFDHPWEKREMIVLDKNKGLRE